MKTASRTLQKTEFAWIFGFSILTTLVISLLTQWQEFDHDLAITLLIAFIFAWVASEVLLPPVWCNRIQAAAVAIAVPILFALLGGFANPIASLTATFMVLIVVLAYTGWTRVYITTFVLSAILVTSLATNPELRFSLPLTADLTSWIWDREWLSQTRYRLNSNPNSIFLYLSLFVILCALLGYTIQKLRENAAFGTLHDANLTKYVAKNSPFAVYSRKSELLFANELFSAICNAHPEQSFRSTFATENSVISASIPNSGLPHLQVAHTTDGKWVNLDPTQEEAGRTLIQVNPVTNGDFAALFLNSCSEPILFCWPNGELVYFNDAMATLIPAVRIGCLLEEVLPATTEATPKSINEHIHHAIVGSRKINGQSREITSTPIAVADTHLFTSLSVSNVRS